MANPLFSNGGGVPTPTPAPNMNQQIANMIGGLKQIGIDPRQIQSMMKKGMNPQAIFGLMSSRYPQAAPQLQQIQQMMQGGQSPKEVAMGMMKAKGIDPNSINLQEIINLVNGGN